MLLFILTAPCVWVCVLECTNTRSVPRPADGPRLAQPPCSGSACRCVCNTQIGCFLHVCCWSVQRNNCSICSWVSASKPSQTEWFFWDLFGWHYTMISKEEEAGDFTGWLLWDETWYPSAAEIKIPFRGKKPQLLLPLSNSFHPKETCLSRGISATHHAPLQKCLPSFWSNHPL